MKIFIKNISLFFVSLSIVVLSACDGPRDDAPMVSPERVGPRITPIFYDELIRNLPEFDNQHNLYFVDAHSQLGNLEVLDLVLPDMAENHVCHTFLSGRRYGTPEIIEMFAADNPRQLTAAVRSKGSAYRRGDLGAFRPFFWNQVISGKYNALAEALIFHARKELRGGPALEVKVQFNDPQVELVTRTARQNGWPLIFHLEFASRDITDEEKRFYMQTLESFLRQNRDLDVVMNQMGLLPASEVRRLIRLHPNIFFTTAQSNPVRVYNSTEPWVNLFSGYKLKLEWKQIFIRYPERIIFALDNVLLKHWRDYYPLEMRFWMSAMNDLPRNIAHKISHGNAERLWRFQLDPACLPEGVRFRPTWRPRPSIPEIR